MYNLSEIYKFSKMKNFTSNVRCFVPYGYGPCRTFKKTCLPKKPCALLLGKNGSNFRLDLPDETNNLWYICKNTKPYPPTR